MGGGRELRIYEKTGEKSVYVDFSPVLLFPL